MSNCVRCGEQIMLEDGENVTEDKEFYCEDCKESQDWKDKFGDDSE